MFDDKWLGDSLKALTSEPWRRLLPGTTGDRALAADANRILNSHHHDKIDSLTRGRSTAFAASHVELYMRPHDGRMPRIDEVGRGDTKTPPLWHTAAKMPVGRWYSDGSFHGPVPMMASSMELEKDRPFDALVDSVLPKIKRSSSRSSATCDRRRIRTRSIGRSPPRARPSSTRRRWAAPAATASTTDRATSAGPAFTKTSAPIGARRDVVSHGFIAAFNGSPLAAEGALEKSRGYAATPLTGVWANFPYLHNGSVPTLYHLLGPVSERPKIFNVMAARRLDRERVGQFLYVDPAHGPLSEAELLRRFGADRDWFSTGTRRVGQRRTRRVAADSDGCEPARDHRISENAVAGLKPCARVLDDDVPRRADHRRRTRRPCDVSRELAERPRPLVLERGEALGHTWANLYDGLVLHTGKHLSALPGMPFPAVTPLFPSRLDFLDYLRRYADTFRVPIETNADVAGLARDNGGWIARTATGRQFRARAVVMATGIVSNPHVPDIPHRDRFRGTVIHSVHYRRPGEYAGQRVLVVGIGNSSGEISVELAAAGVDVTVAVRSGARVVPREILGIPIQYFAVAMSPLPRKAQQAVQSAVGRISELVRGAVLPRAARRPVLESCR